MPRTAALLLALVLAAPLPGLAQGRPEGAAPPEAAEAPAPRLPAERTTEHLLDLGDRSLAFTATAGAVTVESPRGAPEADLAFVAYRLKDADPSTRPITFVVNGGPGAASAYLHIGALGPWRLPFAEGGVAPSQAVGLVPNPETWLDFTDLVFLDPVGTGFSRLVDPDNDRVRDRFLSVDGDVDALADAILAWLTENGRIGSPKYFVGESYGGFRAPLVAEALQTDRGVGLAGLVLVSPVLDFGWSWQPDHAPLPRISLLPSLAAAAMEADGSFAPERLTPVEDYAAGDYLRDLMRGREDPAAVARLVDRVTELTGLDRDLVAESAGRIEGRLFLREAQRHSGRLGSMYDATITRPGGGRGPDPVLDALTAPLTSAMLDFYRTTLGWLPDRRYMLLNGGVGRAWDWDGGLGQPQALDALAEVLALDPDMQVLVAHGYTDLVTPYFTSALILRQLDPEIADQIRQADYRGGHMFYTRDEFRRAFTEDARRLYAGRSAEAG